MEYIRERNKDTKKQDDIWNIIHRDGYPERQNPNMDWTMFFASYVKTYLERDVRKLAAVQNLDTFRRFRVVCATRTSQILNYARKRAP